MTIVNPLTETVPPERTEVPVDETLLHGQKESMIL